MASTTRSLLLLVLIMSRPTQAPFSYDGYKSSTSSRPPASVFSVQSHSTFPTTPSLARASVFGHTEVVERSTPTPTLTPTPTPAPTSTPTPHTQVYPNPYVPMLSGAALTSLPSTALTPHPALSTGESPQRLRWDIRTPPMRHAVVVHHGRGISFSGIANLPATSPPAFTLYISLLNMPWTIVVQSPNSAQPITCQMLLDAVYAQMRAPISINELNTSWKPDQQAAIRTAYRLNRAQVGDMPREICRADAFGSASVWAGLYFNEEQARTQYNIPRQQMNASTVRSLVLTLTLTV